MNPEDEDAVAHRREYLGDQYVAQALTDEERVELARDLLVSLASRQISFEAEDALRGLLCELDDALDPLHSLPENG